MSKMLTKGLCLDQSLTGALRRVERHMGDEATELLKGRVRIIK